jgi:hypothetical protein
MFLEGADGALEVPFLLQGFAGGDPAGLLIEDPEHLLPRFFENYLQSGLLDPRVPRAEHFPVLPLLLRHGLR